MREPTDTAHQAQPAEQTVQAQPLACPFCGSTHALTVDNLAGDDWYVECGACKVQQHAIYPTWGAAIAAWNRRTPPVERSTPTTSPDEQERRPAQGGQEAG